MLQLKNNTPFPVALDCFYDVDGVETLIVTIKSTFTVGSSVQVAQEQLEPVPSDEYWGDADSSSIKQGMDVTLIKPATDIIMTGNACAPRPKKVRDLDVRLKVGTSIDKTVKVFGNRVWKSDVLGLSPSLPEVFDTMPLVYERAYGGVHELESKTLSEMRNPVGQGFKGKRGKKELEGQPMPNLENPEQLIRSPSDTPLPQGFGWLHPSWEPRNRYLGTYDTAWERNRAPYLPEDFDSRYFQAAHPDLICDQPLVGGEPVLITNMSHEGDIQFRLPTLNLAVNANFGDGSEPLNMSLSTLHFQPNDRLFTMTWQGAVSGDKRVLQCQALSIAMQKLQFHDE
ncbi:MAG: DUF2169 domain-containing protein [Reinekea sp.]